MSPALSEGANSKQSRFTRVSETKLSNRTSTIIRVITNIRLIWVPVGNCLTIYREGGTQIFPDFESSSLRISAEDFRQCFQQWERHWDRCIQSKGQYFEGD